MSRSLDAVRVPLIALLMAVAPALLLAATFTVNMTGDAGDFNPGDGICDSDPGTPGEQCTLRAATAELPPDNWSDANDTLRPILGREERCGRVDFRRSRSSGC
jgi:hypothetical protein